MQYLKNVGRFFVSKTFIKISLVTIIFLAFTATMAAALDEKLTLVPHILGLVAVSMGLASVLLSIIDVITRKFNKTYFAFREGRVGYWLFYGIYVTVLVIVLTFTIVALVGNSL